MVQRPGNLDLALESPALDRGGRRGRQDLDHHLAGEPRFLGEEDAAHPAAAELTLDLVAVAEHRLQAVAEVSHDAPERLAGAGIVRRSLHARGARIGRRPVGDQAMIEIRDPHRHRRDELGDPRHVTVLDVLRLVGELTVIGVVPGREERDRDAVPRVRCLVVAEVSRSG